MSVREMSRESASVGGSNDVEGLNQGIWDVWGESSWIEEFD